MEFAHLKLIWIGNFASGILHQNKCLAAENDNKHKLSWKKKKEKCRFFCGIS